MRLFRGRAPRGGQFRARIDDPGGDHGQDKVATAVAAGSQHGVEADFPRGAERGGGVPVRQGAGDGEGVAVRGDDDAAFQHAAQPFDVGRSPMGEVTERAFTNLAAIAVAFAKEDGRG